MLFFKGLRCFLLFLTFLFCVFQTSIKCQSQDPSVLIYPENEFDSISIADYLDFVSPSEGNLLLKDSIIESGLNLIEKPHRKNKKLDSVEWGKVSIFNPNISIQNCFLVIELNLDSLVLYRLVGDKLLLEGKIIPGRSASENYMSTSAKLSPISLFPKQLNTFYLRIYSSPVTNLKSNLTTFHLFQDKYFFNSILKNKKLQIFGETLTLFLGFMSLIVFFIFKSKDFLYFSILIFLMFFLVGGEVGLINMGSQNLISQSYVPESGALLFFLFGALILFGTLFISATLGLETYWVKFRKFYFFEALGFILLAFLLCILIWDGQVGGYFFILLLILMLLFLAWAILSLIAIVQGVVKKRLNAIVLLISFLLLIVVPMISAETSLFGINLDSIGGFTLTSLLPFFITIIYGLFTKVSRIQRLQLTTQIEKEKSEELLFNILPEEIATELKEKGESKAKLIEEVSVLFTDFEGFTEKSEKLSPEDLVKEINVCFRVFDDIIQKYGIEKIKTIGDAYMAAGGLNSPEAKPALNNVVRAGIEMQSFMLERKAKCLQEGRIYFEMRVGVNTGPLVAGVVGVKKFQFDIWGDTVNLASRIESAGQVGKVNISEFSYELLRSDPDFIFENRGKIKVKGKGEIKMWFVELRKK